jgi:hypothetical protein
MTLGGQSIEELRERLFSRVVAGANDCILWVGGTNSGGYGYLKIDGEIVAAHRLSFELAHGPIPEGLVVRHSCHVRNCVSPLHLSVGTVAENYEDMVRAGSRVIARGKRWRWVPKPADEPPPPILRHLSSLRRRYENASQAASLTFNRRGL